MRIRVLITGGAGYIGSHTAKLLAQCGFEPVVLDNLSVGQERAVKWGPFVKGDVGNIAMLHEVIRRYQVQAVIHFAASAYVGESVTNPRKYFHNNVSNTLKLLDAQIDSGVKFIVFSSTCATYGNPETIPISEDHPQKPVNPYGESKLFVERALHWYSQAYGLKWVSLRYFNAAGADLEGEIGEHHDPETHLIPLAIQSALDPRQTVCVYGTDYATPDGTAVRDYLHVMDLAEAHVLALRYLFDGRENTAINLGTGKGHSVRQVIAEVECVGGTRIATCDAPRRAGDPPVLVAAATKATRLLGWHPRYSQLTTIIQTAWKWHCAQGVSKPRIATALGVSAQ